MGRFTLIRATTVRPRRVRVTEIPRIRGEKAGGAGGGGGEGGGGGGGAAAFRKIARTLVTAPALNSQCGLVEQTPTQWSKSDPGARIASSATLRP